MTDKTYADLTAALENHLGGDESANTLVIERKNGPALAIIRADMLEVLKTKAAAFDAQDGGDDESEQDAFSILNQG
jgi:prolyl-tRNA editing enzyme YbaK/EbsC (Cys-tRNA(Pro) deacylase)